MKERRVEHHIATYLGPAPVRAGGDGGHGDLHRLHEGGGGRSEIAPVELQRRIEACRGCSQLDTAKGGVRLVVNGFTINRVACKKCGCGGLSLTTGECPAGKWPKPDFDPGPPVVFRTSETQTATLRDLYKGRSAFLICGGPSVKSLDLSPLHAPGILTMGVNNSPATFRPKLWTHVDGPDHFIRSIWFDPTIIKFSPWRMRGKRIFDSDEWKLTDHRAMDCPGVYFYERNATFNPATYLSEQTINWGSGKRHGGCRSVMLAAIRLLYELGVRRLFLLGADFHMDEQHKYHFDQDRAPGSIAGNNSSYRILNERFTAMAPLFEAAGYQIYNCNAASKLTAFPFRSFDTALGQVQAEFGVDVGNERTAGLYDRAAKERLAERAKLTRGVVYYNRGEKCLERMVVSLASLRDHYAGPLALLYEGSLPVWAVNATDRLQVQRLNIPDSPHALVAKTRIWRWNPFDISLVLDSDTIVRESPEPLFDTIAERRLLLTQFSNWRTDAEPYKSRIEGWRGIFPDAAIAQALAFGPAINGGVVGYTRNHRARRGWERFTIKGLGAKTVMQRTLDEVAMQIVAADPIVEPFIADQRWNYSVKYGVGPVESAAIIHFHGSKHDREFPACNLWRARRDKALADGLLPQVEASHAA